MHTMSAEIINGKTIADAMLDNIRQRVAQRVAQSKRAPALAVVLVGNDTASAIYVRNKRQACVRTGIRSVAYDLPQETSEKALYALIEQLNDDPAIDGILVQSPLPPHIDENVLVEKISAAKDVDGFHPYNIGRLAVRQPTLRSCTPYGVIKLLQSTGIRLLGLDAVVVGVSNHVGRPMVLELLLAGCTVTACHRYTTDLAAKVGQADVLVAAAGKPGLIRGEWIKPGAIVIDIGFNRLPDGKICGDVDFASASQRASWITPVPGGVGPMTVATLMENSLQALESRESAAAP